MTIGELKELIKDLPDNQEIITEIDHSDFKWKVYTTFDISVQYDEYNRMLYIFATIKDSPWEK